MEWMGGVCLHVQTCGRMSSRKLKERGVAGKQATSYGRFAIQASDVNLCVTPLQVFLANAGSSVDPQHLTKAKHSLGRHAKLPTCNRPCTHHRWKYCLLPP